MLTNAATAVGSPNPSFSAKGRTGAEWYSWAVWWGETVMVGTVESRS